MTEVEDQRLSYRFRIWFEFFWMKYFGLAFGLNNCFQGTAEVSYFRQVDAHAAMKRFNNAHLDGKPLKIEFVGVQSVAPGPVPPTKNSIVGTPNVLFTRFEF